MTKYIVKYNNDIEHLSDRLKAINIETRLPLDKFHHIGLEHPGDYVIEVILKNSFRNTAPSIRIEKTKKIATVD